MIFGSLYIRLPLVLLTLGNIIVFVLGFPIPILYYVGLLYFVGLFSLTLLEIMLLFSVKKGMAAERIVAEKLSNGDYNEVQVNIESRYKFAVSAKIIDEPPVQFQERSNDLSLSIPAGATEGFLYYVRPVRRGKYRFGQCNVFVKVFIGLISRRYQLIDNQTVNVYPSIIQLQTFEFMAISNRLQEIGIKKIRRVGQNNEFDQIRDYVRGDDVRKINWKATARRQSLMVNQYQDEKSQHVYCVIDMGRSMKMPFEGLSLLDYAINSSLVFSNIALRKSDAAGVISFNHKTDTLLKSTRTGGQMNKIQEALFNLNTGFYESDYGNLYQNIRYHVHQRSLLVLFTNFESLVALKRQIKYLRQINKNHLLVVVFFENTELNQFTEKKIENTLDVYQQVLAEKTQYEKKLIHTELRRHGIQSVFTSPDNLTVDVINKYMELKSRNMI